MLGRVHSGRERKRGAHPGWRERRSRPLVTVLGPAAPTPMRGVRKDRRKPRKARTRRPQAASPQRSDSRLQDYPRMLPSSDHRRLFNASGERLHYRLRGGMSPRVLAGGYRLTSIATRILSSQTRRPTRPFAANKKKPPGSTCRGQLTGDQFRGAPPLPHSRLAFVAL